MTREKEIYGPLLINVLFGIWNFLLTMKQCSNIYFSRLFRNGTRENPQFRLAKVNDACKVNVLNYVVPVNHDSVSSRPFFGKSGKRVSESITFSR